MQKCKKDIANNDEKANTGRDGAAGESDNKSIAELGLTCVDRLVDAELDPSADEIAMTDHHDEQPNTSANKTKTTSKNVDKHALKCKIDGNEYPSFTSKTMFGDSACSCMLVNSLTGMYNGKDINEEIDGVGSNIKATKKGRLRCLAVQADGSSAERALDPVK